MSDHNPTKLLATSQSTHMYLLALLHQDNLAGHPGRDQHIAAAAPRQPEDPMQANPLIHNMSP